jgi:hypothetical protein
MNRTISTCCLSVILSGAMFAAPVLAQSGSEGGAPAAGASSAGAATGKQADEKGDEKKDDGAILKPGVIAVVGGGAGPVAVVADTGGAAPGDEAAAVTASIRKGKDPQRCEAIVVNSSDTDTYRVSFAVQSFNKKTGKGGSSQSFSATLAPKKTVVKTVTCQREDGMRVVLKKGVRTASTKKKDGEAVAEGAKGQAGATPSATGSKTGMPAKAK